MRRAWPSAAVAVGGMVLVVVGLLQSREPEHRVFVCRDTMDCDTSAIIGEGSTSLLPWCLAGLICFLGAGLLYLARKPDAPLALADDRRRAQVAGPRS